MPLDIWTVYSRCQLDPTIERVICCPKCFKQYPNGGPSQCNWCCSPKSRPCNTNLYTQLSHSQIEDHLYQTFGKSQGVFNPGWTIKAKTAMTKETGVRWTPLHDLPYWDPVQYVILGFMHNFLEGILQYHLQVLWGIGQTKAAIKLLATLQLNDDDTDAETSSNYSEDDSASQHSSTSGLAEYLDNMDVDDENISTFTSSSTPTPSSNAVPLPSDDYDEDEEVPVSIAGAFHFTPTELAIIRACISDIQLPTWVQRPPTNLGEASHGSLKAHELLILFSIIFPLVIPALWWNGTEVQQELLQNFCELVCATNIIAGYSVSNAEADAYMDHYINY
ncbi:hypothetical protein L208DRAFT_1325981, partial [Tricholoma matsutake]